MKNLATLKGIVWKKFSIAVQFRFHGGRCRHAGGSKTSSVSLLSLSWTPCDRKNVI
jgi:hypothetical protein